MFRKLIPIALLLSIATCFTSTPVRASSSGTVMNIASGDFTKEAQLALAATLIGGLVMSAPTIYTTCADIVKIALEKSQKTASYWLEQTCKSGLLVLSIWASYRAITAQSKWLGIAGTFMAMLSGALLLKTTAAPAKPADGKDKDKGTDPKKDGAKYYIFGDMLPSKA